VASYLHQLEQSNGTVTKVVAVVRLIDWFRFLVWTLVKSFKKEF
jgi:hypothetical protein